MKPGSVSKSRRLVWYCRSNTNETFLRKYGESQNWPISLDKAASIGCAAVGAGTDTSEAQIAGLAVGGEIHGNAKDAKTGTATQPLGKLRQGWRRFPVCTRRRLPVVELGNEPEVGRNSTGVVFICSATTSMLVPTKQLPECSRADGQQEGGQPLLPVNVRRTKHAGVLFSV